MIQRSRYEAILIGNVNLSMGLNHKWLNQNGGPCGHPLDFSSFCMQSLVVLMLVYERKKSDKRRYQEDNEDSAVVSVSVASIRPGSVIGLSQDRKSLISNL